MLREHRGSRAKFFFFCFSAAVRRDRGGGHDVRVEEKGAAESRCREEYI